MLCISSLLSHLLCAEMTLLRLPLKHIVPAYMSAYYRLYFDHGTEGLDADYGPYQKQVDELCRAAGYVTVRRKAEAHLLPMI
jgi:hypothetical protein